MFALRKLISLHLLTELLWLWLNIFVSVEATFPSDVGLAAWQGLVALITKVLAGDILHFL